MNDYSAITSWIQNQINLARRDENLNTSEFLLIEQAYKNTINYIESLNETQEYQVDYSCPDRNSFIESSEKCIS